MVSKYGFIGAGQMGEAIFAGLLKKKLARPADVHITDVNAARTAAMHEKHGVTVETDARAVIAAAHLVVLATKPQDMDALLQSLPQDLVKDKLFVSIAAGKPLSVLETLLPNARVVRVMPNLAMRVGEGMSCVVFSNSVTATDRAAVIALLECSGKVRELPENLFDAVTALSGSGPAFFAYVLQNFVEGATSLGMPMDDALFLAKQTMLGTAKVLSESDTPLADFIAQVTSKGGTTAAGRAVLEGSDTAPVIAATLKAAADRSKELGMK